MHRFLMIGTGALVCLHSLPGAAEVVTVPAQQDAFVREQAPTLNFGSAGNLCVAGSDSVNANGEPRGRFDSVIEFDLAPTVTDLDTTYGIGGWQITAANLEVSEQGAPQNSIFPRGVGTARCSWLPQSSFNEGTGSPNFPTFGVGDELTWDYLQTLLAGATEQVLGEFSNAGADGSRVCPLAMIESFANELRTGQVVALHVSPLSSNLGFTFHSRNFGSPPLRPSLTLTIEQVVAGDMNCDNQLAIQDVAAFAQALTDPNAYTATHPGCDITRADIDEDGLRDGRDIASFVSRLLTP